MMRFQLGTEGGYAADASDVTGTQLTKNFNDLLRMIDEQQAGRRQFKLDHVPDSKLDAGQEAHIIVGNLERDLFETGGVDARVDQALADRVVEIVRREGQTDLLSAYETCYHGRRRAI